MILLDLFSGIGGFHKGLKDAGFNFSKVYFSEVDKYAIANYKYNYRDAEHIGAVEHVLNRRIERPDIIAAGSPCQDFSIAGARKGLAGKRSSLIEYFITAISHFRPSVFIWENVKGTFSSNAGADFWAILKAFANIGGYHIEWQLLNTVWFLPQNRERIYLVGRLADKCTGEVFPIGEDDEFHIKKREVQAEICGTITSSFAKMGGDNTYIKIDTMKIRRLTEIECERLQGFPDDYTKYGIFNSKVKEISGTQRYKMLGNAVTAKVVEMVGKRILKTTYNLFENETTRRNKV